MARIFRCVFASRQGADPFLNRFRPNPLGPWAHAGSLKACSCIPSAGGLKVCAYLQTFRVRKKENIYFLFLLSQRLEGMRIPSNPLAKACTCIPSGTFALQRGLARRSFPRRAADVPHMFRRWSTWFSWSCSQLGVSWQTCSAMGSNVILNLIAVVR